MKNFAEFALSHMVFKIQAFLWFAIFFLRKIRKLKKLGQVLSRGILWFKKFVEIILSSTVFEIQAFLKKIRKFKMAAIFGE